MPAKDLSPEQLADAVRLKAAFKAWQAERKAHALPWAQDEVAEALFGFGQSALSQYLNGTIPLNAAALQKFCRALGLTPTQISPGIVEQERARAAWLIEPPAPARPTPPPRPPHRPGIRKTADQKQRAAKKRKKAG